MDSIWKGLSVGREEKLLSDPAELHPAAGIRTLLSRLTSTLRLKD